MRAPTVLLLAAVALAACNTSGLSSKPRATFAQLACLDLNGDHRINGGDAADLGRVPDFNADNRRDDLDAAFLRDVDIPLAADAAAQACRAGAKRQPEYLVAHDYFTRAEVTCGPGERAVLVVGVAGGVDNLKDHDDAAGVRGTVDALIRRLEGREIDTIGVVAGSALFGAENAHTAMEQWLANATRIYLQRHPCLSVALIGFSHGAVSVQAVAARLEAEFPGRFVAVVAIDRIEDFYTGDLSRPLSAPLVNIYQRNSGDLGGAPVDGPNVLNYDASAELGPEHGDQGGRLVPVTHVTIDNSKAVREWIVQVVSGRF